jgi:glucosamine 6-phosphate synthetase-like amidotransferase/phosphosugar isomerase protein
MIEEFESLRPQIRAAENLLILGDSNFYNVALYVSRFFKLFRTFDTVTVLPLCEYTPQDLPLCNPAIIAISSSFPYSLYSSRATVFACCENGDSSLDNMEKNGEREILEHKRGIMKMECGGEESGVRTKSFFGGIACVILMSVMFSWEKEQANKSMLRVEIKNTIRKLPFFISQFCQKMSGKLNWLAEVLAKEKNLVIVGKGTAFAVAKYFTYKLNRF